MLLTIGQIKINEEYKQYVEDAELLGYMPVDQYERHAYFSIGTTNPEFERVVPVFGVMNTTEDSKNDFIFESESSILSIQDKDKSKKILEDIKNNPYVLFFHGPKEGHTGMRFQDKEEALDFMCSFVYFDEIYNDEKILFHHEEILFHHEEK